MTRARLAQALLLLLLLALALASPAAGAKRRADLSTKSVTGAPATLTAGTRFTVKVKVSNVGKAKAGKFTITLFLGRGAKHTSKDVKLGSARVRLLKVHKAKTVKIKAALPTIRSAAASLAPGSYRLLACADTGKKVKERSEKNNCRFESRRLQLTGPVPPVPQPPPAPAFAISKNYDWAFGSDFAEQQLHAGDPVNVTLVAADGLPGQAGYTRAPVPQAIPSGGTTTGLTLSNHDDGIAVVPLPFQFSFAGIPYQSISVSTNGWLSFDAPAWDYWDDSQTHDFRGTDVVLGRFYRGLMPYIADLDLAAGSGLGAAPAGTISETVGSGFVTITWSIGQHTTTTHQPVRDFSVTLFPDGSFRYDYAGPNADGGGLAFEGYSTGNGTVDVVGESVTSVPGSSLLFTPKAFAAPGPAAAGTISTVLPRESTFQSADPGCGLTTAPTAVTDGLVTCTVPPVGVGQSVVRHVIWGMNADAMSTRLPGGDFSGTYQPSGGSAVTDDDELTIGSNFHAAVATNAGVTYTGPTPPVHDTPMTFRVTPTSSINQIVHPSVTIQIPDHTTLDSIKVGLNSYAGCLPQSGSTVKCLLPDGASAFGNLDVTITPDSTLIGTGVQLQATMSADNQGTDAPGLATSPNVT
jgi:hypothetical protein